MDIVDFVPNTMSFNDGMAGFNEITNKGSTKEEMHKMKGIFSLKSVFLLGAVMIIGSYQLSSKAYAEEVVEEDAVELGEVVVTATRAERLVEDVPASVTIISKEEIEKTYAKTVDDFLGRELGVTVVRGRGLATCPGAFQFHMRGTGSSGRVLILRDGVPLNTKNRGGVDAYDLSATSIQDIERIEIVRGAASALYGSSAMGGVINIITRRAEPGLSGNVSLQAGSFDMGIGSLGLRYGAETFGLRFAAERKQADGYQDIDPWQPHWKVAELEFNHISLGGDLWLGESLLRVDYDNFQTDGTDSAREHWHFTPETNRYRASWEMPLGLGEETVFSLKGYYFDKEFSSIAHGFNPATQAFDILSNRWMYSTADYGVMSQISTVLGNHHLVAGIDFSGATVDDHWGFYQPVASDSKFEGEQNIYAAFINNEMHLGERVVLNAGLRYDHWENTGGRFLEAPGVWQEVPELTDSAISPRGGIVYKIAENTRLRASLGTGFRAPTLSDMFSTAPLPAWGIYWLGNPELEPEKLDWSYDVGMETQPHENFNLSLTFYQSRLSDFLGEEMMLAGDPRLPPWLNPGHMVVLRTINIGEVDIHGVEAGLEFRFNEKWSAFINHTYNVSKVKKHKVEPAYEGNYLPSSPRHISVVGFTYDNPRLFTLSLDITSTGSRYAAIDNAVVFDGFHMVNMKVSRELLEGMEIFANVNNLTDEKWQESIHSNVGVPFNFLVGARYAF